jgi:hypothetical protein
MNISLPNGKVVRRSIEEYLFMDESLIDQWYQNMMADDAGEDLETWCTLSEVTITEFSIPETPDSE